MGVHLRPMELVRDLAVLMGLGSLAAFVVLFTGRVVFDNLVHESSLSYSTRMVGAAADQGDLSLTSYADGGVAPPAGVQDIVALERTVDTTVLTFGADRLGAATTLFQGALTAGSLCTDGVAIDEATAANLSVGVGDEVTLWWPGDSEARPVHAHVCGVVNPWHPGTSLGARGYVVSSADFIESVQPGVLSTQARTVTAYWFSGAPVGSSSKASAVRGVLASNAGWSAFVWAVALLGLALWSFGVVRVWNAFRSGLAEPWQVLWRLGVHPAVPPLFVSTAVTVMAAAASCASAVIARSFILGWTSLYVTSRQIWLVAAVLVGVSMAISALFVRRYVRRM
jgi:hypothetical protein